MKKFLSILIKTLIVVLFLAVLVFIAFDLQAQTTSFTGCVIYEHNSGTPRLYEPIYTQPEGGSETCNGYPVLRYSDVTTASNLNSYCGSTMLPNASSSANPDRNYRNCTVNGRCGIIRTVTVTECPIDDDVLGLLFAVSSVAIYFIKSSSILRFSVV